MKCIVCQQNEASICEACAGDQPSEVSAHKKLLRIRERVVMMCDNQITKWAFRRLFGEIAKEFGVETPDAETMYKKLGKVTHGEEGEG